jgi:outer membrane protein
MPRSFFAPLACAAPRTPSPPRRATARRLAAALALALGLGTSGVARADTLLQVFALAQRHNPQLRGARAAYAAALQRVPLARSRLLPQIRASAGVGDALHDETGNPLLHMFGLGTHWNYLERELALDATQNLYSPGDEAAVGQARLGADLAYARLAQADQNLMVEVAQDYFGLLAARDSLRSLQRQQDATELQLRTARAQFAAGHGTILDVRDAQARQDLLQAQRIAADNQQQLAHDALQTLVGAPLGRVAPLLRDARLPPAQGRGADWARRAERDNLAVTQARLQMAIARLQVRRAESEALPTVQAYARLQRASTSGGGPQFPFGDRVDSASVGVRLQWPLFTGYAVQSEQGEDTALLDKAQDDLDAARSSAALQARSALAAWTAAQARAQALRSAILSSRSALQANRTGYGAGLRVSVDVLNATAQLYDTERQADQARYDSLLQALRLKQAAGRLDERDLAEVSALLQP